MDRNLSMGLDGRFKLWSLSARRAWIEIIDDLEPSRTRKVALRKESVDRNKTLPRRLVGGIESLSARRAWIEIFNFSNKLLRVASLSARRAWIEIPAGCWRESRCAVALRKESVDRNYRLHY